MNIEELCVQTIKGLAIDAVEQAGSGHPGMPLGAADIAFVLWSKFLKQAPSQPDWADRDRFILSAGHSSTLLYALLHLTGYDVSLDDLRDFRQLGSKTPGHPEYWCIPGVEATTGQLGQGFAMGVGLSIAERILAERFNTAEYMLVDHRTYAIVSDGDLMEGISSEAASLAGHLKLGKLIYLYDDNHITIEGSTELAFSEDVTERFKAYGWDVSRVDGHNRAEIEKAILRAQDENEKPSLIACRTTIAKGSPNKAGSAESHGSPLGAEEAALTRANLGLPSAQPFFVDERVLQFFAGRRAQLEKIYSAWRESEEQYIENLQEAGRDWRDAISGKLPDEFENLLPRFETGDELATRSCSGKALNAIAEAIPSLIGGSADLSPSTKTTIDKSGDISSSSFSGQNIHFGVREHAMGGVLNGLALHKGIIPFGATFFVFSDYMRPAIRLSAMMKLRVIYIFSHDSIFVGEDGPTHQPVEQLMALRLIPGLTVLRPADGNETAQAWAFALRNTDGPTAILLTRQKVRTLSASGEGSLRLGAYEVMPQSSPDVIIIATGSEVSLAIDAAEELALTHKKSARVLSMPSWELFEKQPASYRTRLLPPDVPKVAIEAGRSQGWERFVGSNGLIIGIDEFGLSGNFNDLSERFGLTVPAVVERIVNYL